MDYLMEKKVYFVNAKLELENETEVEIETIFIMNTIEYNTLIDYLKEEIIKVQQQNHKSKILKCIIKTINKL